MANKTYSEIEISIPLKNFTHNEKSGVKKRSRESNFIGRLKEKERFLNNLIQGKNGGGSFLISGYRGVGKTRFVCEALSEYERKKGKFIEVKINLGNDGDLTSKVVLYNMVYLLNNALRNDFWVKFLQFPFGNLIRGFLFLAIIVSIVFAGLVFFEPVITDYLQKFPSFDARTLRYFLFSLILILIACWILIHDGKTPLIPCWKAFVRLRNLQKKIYATVNDNSRIQSNYFSLGKKIISTPLTSNQIEAQLKDVLYILKNKDVIFIFDELDKLSGRIPDLKDSKPDLIEESKFRKQQVDSILGDLKNLITNSNARYIFISGRDIYDAYLSERGSSNSLYESLFNAHIYIPSLLTDRSDGENYLLDGLIETFVVSNLIPAKLWRTYSQNIRDHKGSLSNLKLSDYLRYKKELLRNELETEVKKSLHAEAYILKTLIHFLTLHSWGNCKRLLTLFESFVRAENGEHHLYFTTRDIQRLVLASQLYILFHHNLSRMLMNVDDKLVVSSFSIFHYILKYHGIGFCKEDILRMYETINIHSSPELIRIVDIIIHSVLSNHIRQVRNSLYQYRFTYLHEKEIHFITTINDGESAAFNFSLNAMDAVKQHYKNLIRESKHTHADESYGHNSLASIHVIVGNFHFWEQSFDEALIHYTFALDILKNKLLKANDAEKVALYMHMIEIYLKQGSAEERVTNYTVASIAYLNADVLARDCLKIIQSKNTFSPQVNLNDTEWNILNQPKWAKLFLNLKLSNSLTDTYFAEKDAVSIYKQAVLSFFMEDYPKALHQFMNTINLLKSNQDSERDYFLEGNAYLRASFSLLLNYSSELHRKIKIDSKNELRVYAKDFVSKLKSQLENLCSFSLDDYHQKNNHFIYQFTRKSLSFESFDAREVIKLLHMSADSFEKGKLYSNANISYFSVTLVWEAFLEMIPWIKREEGDFWNDILDPNDSKEIRNLIEKLINNEKNWISDAHEKAFEFIGKNTGDAYHHSMKSAIERNLKENIYDQPFFQKTKHKEKILRNEHLLFQQYSLMGQVIAASIAWENIATTSIAPQNHVTAVKTKLLENSDLYLLPYGIRYYSMMLWLRGRNQLTKLLQNNDQNKNFLPKEEPIRMHKDTRLFATSAIVNFFRASQYVIKTHGEISNMILPPLFVMYYNMWEILVYLVEIYLDQLQKEENSDKKSDLLEKAKYSVRHELSCELEEHKVRDVSSRMLDLSSIHRMAQEQFRIVERMGDITSNDRLNVLKNKYYLDDDFEDNMFILDWGYCRFFAPGALIYRKIMDKRMQDLFN